jgi:DNA polymerase-4
VASTKFVAKLASARCKPDGLLVVPAADVLDFLHPLPVTVLGGVGARTAEPLHRLGVRTVGDLADIPVDTLRRAVGAANAEHLHALAWGRDPREVEAREVEKSISADHTVAFDLTDEASVRRELLRLSDEVTQRLRERAMVARTVGIKIRFADFRTVTRVRTMGDWVESTGDVYDAAVELYRGLSLDRPRIRLVGVKVEGLRGADEVARQLSFDDAARGDLAGVPDTTRAARAVDAARARFGPAAVGRGTLLGGRAALPDPDRPGGQ